MSDYWKAFIAGMIWTALEAGAAALTMYIDGGIDPVKAIIGVVIAVMIFAAKTLKIGFPEIEEDTMQDEEGEVDD